MVDMEVNVGDYVLLVYLRRRWFTRQVYGLVQSIKYHEVTNQPLAYTVERTNIKVKDIILIHKYERRSEHSD